MKNITFHIVGHADYKELLCNELTLLGHCVNNTVKTPLVLKEGEYFLFFDRNEIDTLATLQANALSNILVFDETKQPSICLLRDNEQAHCLAKVSTANTHEEKIDLWLDAIIALARDETGEKIDFDWQHNHVSQSNQHPKQPLLSALTGSLADIPPLTIDQLIEEQARLTPHAIAVRFLDSQQTFQELDQQSNQLAHHLRSVYLQETGEALTADTLIPLCLNRGIDMMVAIIAILKAGAAYVPLTPETPASRIAFIIEDTKALVMISQSSMTQQLAQHNHCLKAVINIDNKDYLGAPKNTLKPIHQQHHLAYVIYTSGTTGQPKGVMIEHKNVINLISAQIHSLQLTSNSISLLFSRIAFDASIGIIFPTLAVGGSLVILPQSEMSDIVKLANCISDNKVTVVSMIPTVIKDLSPQALPSVETLELGGEVASEQLISQWLAAGVNVVNAYGPTETTVCAINHHFTQAQHSNCIGKPIANTQAYILDENLKPVTRGDTGELYLAGAGIARGYLNLASLTAEKFLDNPFVKQHDSPFQTLYKTNDIVCATSNGELLFKGRSDHQVKLNGYRVELSSIDNHLLSHDAIKLAATILFDRDNNHRLIAFVVIKKDQPFSQSQLKGYLASKLPHYMIPSEIICLTQFKLTANSKIDRHYLFDIVSTSSKEIIKPNNELETAIHHAWCHVFKLTTLSTEEDFYALGGDSLKATALLMEINKICITNDFAEYPLSFIFENLSIKEQAKKIQTDKAENNQSTSYHITAQPQQDRYPLSRQQARYFFLNQYDLQGKLSFIVPLCFKIEGELSVNALSRAIDELIRRHSIFRYQFLQQDGELFQHEQVFKANNLTQKTLTEEAIKADIESSVTTPFNLENGYIYRFTLYQVKDSNQYIFSFIHHHIIADGWSLALFYKELKALYEHYTNATPLNLAKFNISYGDYCLWEKNALASDGFKQKKDFWQTYLSDYEPVNLRPNIQSQTKRGATHTVHFQQATTNAIHTLSEKYSATMLHVLHACLAYVLYRYTGQNNITLGTLVANRFHQSCDNIFGPFINIIPLFLQIDSSQTVDDFFKQAQASCLQALTNQEVPFDDIVSVVNPDRVDADQSLVNVWLVIQDKLKDVASFNLAGLEVTEYPVQQADAQADLVFNIYQTTNSFKLVLKYAAHKFDSHYIAQLVEHLQNTIVSFASDALIKIADNAMISASSQQALLKWSNHRHHVFPVTHTLTALFEEQVKQQAERIACCYQQQRLTYGELNALANQLAHRLRKTYTKKYHHDMPTGTRIALCIERGIEQIVAILATIKAGGAYVPIDPHYPQERIDYILSDCDASLLLHSETIDSHVDNQNIACLNINTPDQDETSTDNLNLTQSASDVAYIIYTSGTTGQPKGVIQTHHNVIRLLYATADQFNFNNQDIWTMFHSYVFDFSVWEIWGALVYGGKLLLPTYLQTRDATQFVKYCVDNKATVLNQTPSAFYQFANAVSKQDGILNSLRYIIFGGDKLQNSRLKSWWQYALTHHLNTKLINMYGITETTVHVTYKQLEPEMDQASNIGRPLNDLSTYVLDSDLNLVPAGVVGELYIGGAGLSPAYLNKQALTETRFIPHPFLSEHSPSQFSRVYRTGDLAQWMPNGELNYIGRNDSQVQVHGFRIELGEIEATLNKIEDVHLSRVLAKTRQLESDIEDTYLIAYCQLEENAKISTSNLQSLLKKQLPSHMIPQYFITVTHFPMTINGKIDYQALPHPNLSIDEKAYVAPSNENEKNLCDLWATALDISRVSMTDNFFEIGGNSIVALQLAHQMSEMLNQDITVADLFTLKTIQNICAQFVIAQPETLFSGEL